MNQTEAQELLNKYNAGTATDEERAIVENWYTNSAYPAAAPDQENIIAAKDRIWAAIDVQPHRTVRLWPRIAVAACILLFLSVGAYFYFKPNIPQQVIAKQQDILPGHNQATLTLANGQKIILTKGLMGKLAQQGQTAIQANGTNGITYTAVNTVPNTAITYNTLATAKGEQSPYPLILADGTKVWLNAESSITFPTAFTGNERLVKVKGEAYFEVAHNARQPFRVSLKNQTIEDIGTQFNVNAYDDEPMMKTTLVEGRIKIISGTEMALLKPGQQASTVTGSNIINVENADVDEAVAWKNGLFSFKQADIKTVMRQISRWYDLDVEYQGVIPDKRLTGEVYRSASGNEALQILKYANIPFRVEGKRIVISTH
jgi:transmembrane sensor